MQQTKLRDIPRQDINDCSGAVLLRYNQKYNQWSLHKLANNPVEVYEKNIEGFEEKENKSESAFFLEPEKVYLIQFPKRLPLTLETIILD